MFRKSTPNPEPSPATLSVPAMWQSTLTVDRGTIDMNCSDLQLLSQSKSPKMLLGIDCSWETTTTLVDDVDCFIIALDCHDRH